jgi:hypothetical protein
MALPAGILVLEEEKLIYVWSIQKTENEFTGILTGRDFLSGFM